MKRTIALALALALSVAVCLSVSASAMADEWSSYGHDLGGTRFSPLTNINTKNVARLHQVWTFHTSDIALGRGGTVRSGFETTPLLVDGRLFITTGFNRIIALDPVTGKQIWVFDPKIRHNADYGDGFINRGVAFWRDARAGNRPCAHRLYEATVDARLLALDARTGAPCADFGANGEVDLTGIAHYRPGWYHMTSPPLVLDGVVVVGSSINDNTTVEMPDGLVRGFDARSGKQLWSWEPLQRPPQVPPGGWHSGAANAWSVLSADPARHLIYVPTGSASPDYYGGLRPGDDKWADSVVALRPQTGEMIWGFQLVHHDLWDYDTAASPLVTTIKLNGKPTEAVIAGNKTGMLYVLDPATGRPLLPIQERPVPQSTVEGESTSPTQPFPMTLPPLTPQSLAPEQAWGRNEADRKACESLLRSLSGLTTFSPPSLQGTLTIPSNYGGMNWSSFAWDAVHERLIVPVTELPGFVQLISASDLAAGEHGRFRGELGLQSGAPYAMVRDVLKSPAGTPCAPPPWGELVAVDLAAGKIAWHRPLGSMSEIFPGVPPNSGSLMLGGPIVTAGGLIFIGGTFDRRFRALSSETGEELWSAELPLGGNAQPMTYEVNGKQFVVIAAGGHAKISEVSVGDALVAFALR
ncbi:MAG TPA: pyrroloquinoline quinone-dependent dehydrogenase [Steroidobacteraceae bacterium]|nr:pyrroloquinoline quinone-dependent dehydrogenase [Steroidobacteraceae bacterium]